MPKLKPGTIIPTPDEDAVIQRGIDTDPDTMEFGEAEARRAKRMGRPPLEAPKVPSQSDTTRISLMHSEQPVTNGKQG